MASSSDGHGSEDSCPTFKILTKADFSILDENESEIPEPLNSHDEIESCLNNSGTFTLNEERKSSVKCCGLKNGEITWEADTAEEVTQFCMALRNNDLKDKLNNFLKKSRIQEKLRLGHGKIVDVDVRIKDLRKLKEDVKTFKKLQEQQQDIRKEDHRGQMEEGTRKTDGKSISKQKQFRVCLHVSKDLNAKEVKMRYNDDKGKPNKQNLEFDSNNGLWFSKEIHQQSRQFVFAFDIYKSKVYFATNATPSASDSGLRSCQIMRPMLRKVFKHSVEGFVAQVIHICHENKTEQIENLLEEVDDLLKESTFNDNEKRDLACDLVRKLKRSSTFTDAKYGSAVGYISGKLQVKLDPAGSMQELALFVLNSFSSLKCHCLSDSQLSVMKVCAELMCKSAYPGTSCILLLMKHTRHLFSKSYFKSLHERKVMTFSSGNSDNDYDLQVEMFNELAENAELDEDKDSVYLFNLLIECLPLDKALNIHYEMYPNLVKKVDQLLEDRITVQIVGLQNAVDLTKLKEFCTLMSTHPTLVDKHFVELRKLVFLVLRSPPIEESWTQNAFFQVMEIPCLFEEKKDVETLLHSISKSRFESYHALYLELLDRLNIHDAAFIAKTACQWLDVCIQNMDERLKTPTDGIQTLYEQLLKIVVAQKVKEDINLLTKLKDKVYKWLVGIDIHLVIERSLQKNFCGNYLFFEHLNKFATVKRDELLQIFEYILKKNDVEEVENQGYKVISIGLNVLGQLMNDNTDDNFILVLVNWRLCLAAITSINLQENGVVKKILETRQRFHEQVLTKRVKVHVVNEVVNLCKKEGREFLTLEKLFFSMDTCRLTPSPVRTLQEAVKYIEELLKEVKIATSVLKTTYEGLSSSRLRSGVIQIIEILQEREKILHNGFCELQMVHDRSLLDPFEPLILFCYHNCDLLGSQVFHNIFLEQDISLPVTINCETVADFLLKVMSNAEMSFKEYWRKVCSENRSEIHISDLHVVPGRKLTHEVQKAEKVTSVKVPSEIYDALHLAGDHILYLDKADVVCSVFELLDLDINCDTTFKRAVNSIKSVAEKTDTCSLAELVNASQNFKEVNEMLDTETHNMMKEFSNSKTLLQFIREIQGEDLRNLIDAVEEHSEQSVQEVTVSSLIDVQRFFKSLFTKPLTNSVLEVMTILISTKDLKPTHLATELQECNNHLQSLKSLYHNVGNRVEVTRVIIKALVSDESVVVQFEICANKNVEMLVRYKGDRKLSKKELSDHRSRALLLVNADTPDPNEDLMAQFRQFIEFVDSALTTSNVYEKLVQCGYSEVKEIKVISVKRSELKEKETSLKKELNQWVSALENARNKWYWLNHFHPEEIKKIQLFMEDGLFPEEVPTLFRSAGCVNQWTETDIADPDFMNRLKSLYLNNKKVNDDDDFSLLAIGATLEELMKNEIAVGPCFPDDSFDNHGVRPLDKVQSGELYVVNLTDNHNIIVTLMTLYRNTTGRVPCHHQVLFCTEQTSWESILLHLNKCVYGKKRGFNKQLYCIIGVEKLGNEKLYELLNKLNNLGDSINYLAIICQAHNNHPLINHFSKHLHKLKPMLNERLKKCIRKLSPGVLLLTSDLPGQGKTYMAQCQAFEQGLEFISYHISGHVSEETLISKFSELDLHDNSLFHLDIGSLSNGADTDILLFKLVVLGFLSTGDNIFSKPTKFIFVEIANSINGTLLTSLTTTQYFKCEHLTWKNFRNYSVSQELNSPVQVVCHYLAAYLEGNLDDADIYFSGDGIKEPLSERKCQNLLREMFASFHELSFSVMNILLNVLADQLKKMSCSLFLRTSHLFEMVGVNTVKSTLVRAILEVSKEFATRSAVTCREEQNKALDSKTEDHTTKSLGSLEVATASEMTERLKGMIQWEESNHLVISFHNQDIQTLSALYRDKPKVPEHVKTLFETQMKHDLPDFSKMSSSELMKRLQQVARSKPSTGERSDGFLDAGYQMTPDSLLKMILIIMRMNSHVPLIIMGETGCGKTSLLRQLVRVCDVTFLVKNMHAGIELEDIVASVENACETAKQNLKEHVWLFFDEINTCDHMGLLNDLLCHRVYKGQHLLPNLSILAACNPYKLRKKANMLTAGLDTKIKTDEQSKLVYRVHPLPESMVDYVWDFGSLTDADEKAYIKSMVNTSLHCVKSDLLVDLLVMSQRFIRQVDKSPYSVSLRDVNRCRLLVPWFRDSLLPKLSNHKKPHLLEIEAIIMALAHSYHSRLTKTADRETYRAYIAHILQTQASSFAEDCYNDGVLKIIHKYQEAILDKMTLPNGIARNTALQENVFVIFVCLLMHLPIFLVGKPGCSKSLSLQLLKSNLRGKDSDDRYFKTLPQLYFVSFQGSESSTSDGILKVFDKAQNYCKHNKVDDVLPVVILDEIGLAELSSYNPLKVLHSLLEPENKEFPDVAVVGISNWALDAAKMNRAIHLSRPEMSENELHKTAISIAEDNSETNLRTLSDRDKTMLRHLASAYYDYVDKQPFKNFHGLRDFYSLIKFNSRETREKTETETYSSILTGLLRNFGGLRSEIKFVMDTFNAHLKDFRNDAFDKGCPSLIDLVYGNITDYHARHLMLLTKGGTSLSIVEDLLRTHERQYMTILGSSFEKDQSDQYIYRILNRIILCMERGITIILKDLETIYGSLYDMLNQNYTVVGSRNNCRIALGQHSKPLCRVHEKFRCIVLVEEQKVDFADPPFLNRFEKQRLVISDLLTEEMKELAKRLNRTIEDLSKVSGFQDICPAELVPIFNSDMIPSLVHSEFQLMQDLKTSGDIENNCWQKVLTLCTPEGMVRAEKSALETNGSVLLKSLKEEYFKQSIHDGLQPYLCQLLSQFEEGVAAMIFTHSNIYTDLPCLLKDFPLNCQFEKLGAFKSEKELTAQVKRFFSDPNQTCFFIQVSHTDQKHFLLMKSILEQERKNHLTAKTSMTVIKHVVVVIHIDRTNEYSADLVNFLSGWHLVVMDTLENQQPSLRQMFSGTLMDLSQKLLSDNGISRQELFAAFAYINYTDKSRPMESIEELIDIIFQNDIIKKVLYDLVNDWISNEPSLKRNRNWQLDVACNRAKLKTNYTFHSALLEEVKSKLCHPVAAAVFTIEKLNGWDLLTSRKGIQFSNNELERWKSFAKSKQVVDITGVAEPKGIECYPCRLTTLNTKFPFSNFFIQKIETLNGVFLDIWRGKQLNAETEYFDESTSAKLHGMFRTSVKGLASGLFETSCEKKDIYDYLSDYCQWFAADLPLNMSDDQRIDVIMQAIKVAQT